MVEDTSQTSSQSVKDASAPLGAVTRSAAFRAGARKGAKRGFLIVGPLAALIGAFNYTLVYTFARRPTLETPLQAAILLPIAACVYGLVGAAIGAAIAGTNAARRFDALSSASDTQQPKRLTSEERARLRDLRDEEDDSPGEGGVFSKLKPGPFSGTTSHTIDSESGE
jgi:hypothetical protein